MQPETQTLTDTVSLSPEAAKAVKELLTERNVEGGALRVYVAGRSCSGLQYGMAIEPEAMEGDAEVSVDGVRLLVDSVSLDYLRGANIDFIEDLMGGGFRIENPNATSSCGCGHSFRTGDGHDAAGGGCSSCG